MMLVNVLTVLAVVTAAAGGQQLLQKIKVDPVTQHFVDEDGRVRMFRGINQVNKGAPWYPELMLEEKHQQELKDWGFNLVRLGSMWSGLEPEEGKYDANYVNILEQIVEGLESHGVYTFFDMHQDVLSSKFIYDGIPRWLFDQFSVPEHEFPWPFVTDKFNGWFCAYFTEECGTAFQQLYNNTAGAADKMAAVWAHLADINNGKNSVLGYEIINEPWAGDMYADPTILLPGNAGHKNLAPLYEKVAAAIREVNKDALILYEAVTWGYLIPMEPDATIDFFLNNLIATQGIDLIKQVLPLLCGPVQPNATEILLDVADQLLDALKTEQTRLSNPSMAEDFSALGPGFTQVPGGPEFNDRSVFSWHYYCWLNGYSNADANYTLLNRGVCDNALGPLFAYTSEERTKRIGGGRLLTEFGECLASAANTDGQGWQECDWVLSEAESHLSSWTYWDVASGIIFWDSEGEPIVDHVKLFSRPYPIATAGTPYSISFDTETRFFTYLFESNTAITSPTDIFVPPLWYPSGEYQIQTSEDLSYTVDETNPSIIHVMAVTSEIKYSFFQISPMKIKNEL